MTCLGKTILEKLGTKCMYDLNINKIYKLVVNQEYHNYYKQDCFLQITKWFTEKQL